MVSGFALLAGLSNGPDGLHAEAFKMSSKSLRAGTADKDIGFRYRLNRAHLHLALQYLSF